MGNGGTIKKITRLQKYCVLIWDFLVLYGLRHQNRKNKHVSTPKQMIAITSYLYSLEILGSNLFIIRELKRVLEIPQLSLFNFQIIVLEATILLIYLFQRLKNLPQNSLLFKIYRKKKKKSWEFFGNEHVSQSFRSGYSFTSPEKGRVRLLDF